MAFPIAVLALLFAASALAGIAPQGVSHRGRVTDFSAEPLAGVDVSCLSKGHVVGRAETDDAGAYVLKASAVACDTVSFSLEGFRTEEFRDGAPEVLDVTLRLGRMDDAPNPRVMGDVVTFQGKPARDASVWALTLGRREADGTRTDAGGHFAFEVESGDYVVCARLPGSGEGASCQVVRVAWLGDRPAPMRLRLPKPTPPR